MLVRDMLLARRLPIPPRGHRVPRPVSLLVRLVIAVLVYPEGPVRGICLAAVFHLIGRVLAVGHLPHGLASGGSEHSLLASLMASRAAVPVMDSARAGGRGPVSAMARLRVGL